MATRSRIGIQLSDESVLSVYHHWDGYPEWLGRILNTHYNTKEKVEELIDGGDMSSCWTNEFWNDNGIIAVYSSDYGPNYYKFRGEDCPPRLDPSLELFLEYGEEYAYLFTDGEWVCYDLHGDLPEQVEIPSPLIHVG